MLNVSIFHPLLYLPWNVTLYRNSYLTTYIASHAHTVVWECCKDDQQSQWEMPYSGVCLHRNPWVDFQKNARLITLGTPPNTQVLRSIGTKGACLCMREIVTLRRLFFSFFRLHPPWYRSDRWTDWHQPPVGSDVTRVVAFYRVSA